MLKTMRVVLIAAVAVLILPAAASAATKVYGGKADIGGDVAMDVKLSKSGAAKRITELRAVGLPGTCEISGPDIPLNAGVEVDIKVSKQGKFEFEFTDDYANTSTFSGKFSGKGDKLMTGKFLYANHFPAEGPYPEENCATEQTGFKAKKGGPNVIEPPVQTKARW